MLVPTTSRCWVQCRAGNEGPQSIYNHKEGIVSQQVEGPSRDHLRDCETSNFAKGRCSSSAVTCCLGLTFSHLGPGLKHFACLLSFSCNLRRAARHPAVFRLQRPEAGTRTDELNYTHIMEPSMQGGTQQAEYGEQCNAVDVCEKVVVVSDAFYLLEVLN